MKNTIPISILILTALFGCNSAEQSDNLTKGVNDLQEMSQVISSHINTGMSADQAEQFMRQEGFLVSRIEKGSFSHEGVVLEDIDYLYCDRTDGGSIVVQRWQVAIIIRNETVVDILVNSGLIGP